MTGVPRFCVLGISMGDWTLAADQQREITNQLGRCQVCGFEWVIKADSDKKGCPFCDAGPRAVTIVNEETT